MNNWDEISTPRKVALGIFAVFAVPAELAVAFVDDFLVSQTIGPQYGGKISYPLIEANEEIAKKIVGADEA